ncbi:MurR/RpiR family transcriptional regulator [Companilactobacillus mishanensis]|uniref:MurR/RpiR family transcriptional regulator n=1 Tax=Companilactobacillus mishanensis TaxID=2486008 RepID=A0ABW9P549_9LACO|nr:MurR/RpiR family transcriptional regulator [Companilactobacillus mishanensis]MQS44207.1 MurR/RpiR family transcriptional regulator [Companilactobacillus mishanensis]
MDSILLTIKQSKDNLTKTEQSIAEYILKNPHEVIKTSVQELAPKIPTSPASIVRFSQRLCGNGGYSDLKLRLSAESDVDTALYEELSPSDSIDDMKKKLSFRVDQTLTKTNSLLSEERLKAAINLFNEKNTIIAYGIGASMIAAQDLQQKLLRVGKTVVTNIDLHLLTTLLLAKKNETVLVLISNSGETKEIIKFAKIAHENNVPVISLTQNESSSLGYESDIVLKNDDSSENARLRSAATTSLISQLYAIDILYYSYFSLHFTENVKQISLSQKYISNNFKKDQ